MQKLLFLDVYLDFLQLEKCTLVNLPPYSGRQKLQKGRQTLYGAHCGSAMLVRGEKDTDQCSIINHVLSKCTRKTASHITEVSTRTETDHASQGSVIRDYWTFDSFLPSTEVQLTALPFTYMLAFLTCKTGKGHPQNRK